MDHPLSNTESLLFLEEPYEWEKLVREFSWVRDLRGCPQDPVFHAEGDVFVHTRMVVETLMALPAWGALPAEARQVVFAACLLHDIGKPATTVIEDDGRITSRGHSRRGERMARQIMALGSVRRPFALREQVCGLVRYHSLPLWLLDKDDPLKAATAASLKVNTAWLALVAEADMRGRTGPDLEGQLFKIDLFREFCREHNCYGQPYTFPSAHSRFVYFHKPNGYPTYEAFDDTQFEVFLMMGLPGSGKDTWIMENCPDLPVVSLDAVREQMGIDPKDNQGPVLQRTKEYAKELMRRKQSFVWNATNVSRSRRAELIDLFTVYKGRVTIVFLDTPIETVIAQNRGRTRVVPEPIIYRFLEKLETPDLTEAQRVVVVERQKD
jgi:putative nucleotidyltransferase with HDIG domain